MALDAATLLSRTTAGDAELGKATNGLSLGQRKLLTFLDQPQALEELADERSLERAKLERDLAKLASLGLIAMDGEHSLSAATSVVLAGLGGLRKPSMLRWLLPLLVAACAAAVYYAIRSPAVRKPVDAPASISAGSSSLQAPVVAAASVVDAPVSMPPAAPTVSAPVGRAANGEIATVPVGPRPATAQPAVSGSELARATPRAGQETSVPVRSPALSPTLSLVPVTPAPATARNFATAPAPATPTAPEPRVATATNPSAPVGDPTSTVAVDPSSAAQQAALRASAPALVPPVKTGVAEPVSPATLPVARAATPGTQPTAVTQQTAPVKLAMAAPGAAAALPPAAARLLPLTRPDPEFPREAITRGVATGTVTARVTIDAAGHVSAVSIVDARPSRVFDRAVTDALSRWTFPAGEGGRSTEVQIAFHRD
ncbi:MAG: TonB family protein [Casimicrobiaceae bacterium]